MSSDESSSTTRRKVLAASGSATMLGLAGCLGGEDDDETGDEETQPDSDDGGAGSEDGDEPTEATVSLLVEGVGDEHDHDYHHDGLSVSEIEHACSHMEFDEREPLEGGSTEDDAPVITSTHEPYDVTFTGDAGYVKFELEDDDHDSEIATFDIIDRDTDEVTADIHGDHWHGSLPHIEEGEHISLGAHIEDDHGDEIELDGDHYELRVALAEDAAEDVVSFDYHGDHVHIIGEHEGETEVVFQLYHDDHLEYETPSITAEVEHDHEDHGDEDAEFEEFEIVDRDSDEVTAYVDGDHWHGELPHIHEGEHISLGANIVDADGEDIELDGDHYELRVDYAHDADEDVVSFDYHGDHVHIIGDEDGETEVVFQLYHDDHTEFETPAITAEVEHDHGDGHGDEYEDDHEHEESEFSTFDIIDRDTDEVTADIHGDHWHGSLPHIEEGEHISLGAHIEDDHGDEVELDGDHYELRVALAEDAEEDVVSFDYHGDHVHIIGEHEGETEVVFQLYHDDHVEFETPSITAEVEHGHDHGHEEDEHGEKLAFFTEHGSVSVAKGEEVYTETAEVGECGPMDRYVVVEPDHGEAIVELRDDL